MDWGIAPMPAYEFKALNRGGKIAEGVLEADSEDSAAAALRGRGYFPLRLAPAHEGAVPIDLASLPKAYEPGSALDPKTLEALEKRLLDGADDAYFELIGRLEGALETLERYPGDLAAEIERRLFGEMLKSLRDWSSPGEARRSALEIREHREDLKRRALEGDAGAIVELAPIRLGPGTLESRGVGVGVVGAARTGTLHVDPDVLVGFVWEESGRREARVLAAAKEMAGIDLGGWKRGRILLSSRGGETWTFTLPRKSMGKDESRRALRNLLLIKRLLGMETKGDIARDLFGESVSSLVLKGIWDACRPHVAAALVSIPWGFAWMESLVPWLRSWNPGRVVEIVLGLILGGLPFTISYVYRVIALKRKAKWTDLLLVVLIGGALVTFLMCMGAYGIYLGAREVAGLFAG